MLPYVQTQRCVSPRDLQDLSPMTRRTGDAGHWVLPVNPAFLLLGDDELVFWTGLVCLFGGVFCNSVPSELTESNSTLVSSANTACGD